MLMSLLGTMATLMLSYLFVVGGYQKLTEASHFQRVVRDYRIIPAGWSAWFARGLPVLELATGTALLVPMLQLTALGVAALLLVAYSAAMALNIIRGRRDLDCGCAGPGQEQAISGWLVGRNGVLLSLVLLSLSIQQSVPLGLMGWSLAFLGATCFALFYHAFNQLITNRELLRRITHHG